jgi:Dynamin family
MSDTDELQQLRDYGAALRDHLAVLTPPAQYAAAASELASLANRLIAEAAGPLRIGVVGEFSSGKSLLLGVLLGNPSLLPTSPHPTTGNVTELRFSRQAGGHSGPAQVTKAEIRYFTREDLDGLDCRLMDELRTTATRLHVAEPAASASTDGLIAWCGEIWRSADPVARKLIREILSTRAAAAEGASMLGTPRKIAPDKLKDVLQIPRVNAPDVFPGASSLALDPAGAEHPAWAFPLIERVVLDVSVAPQAWNLSALPAESEFVLLDFPGVGGGLTHVRDLYLTQRGLRDVHTVLVMVDSEKPGGRAADDFYGFLRELTAKQATIPDAGAPEDVEEPLADRLLYCATRFDLLRPPDEAELGAGPLAGITEQGLLSKCEPLWTLLQSGHRPGASSMSAMLSSVTAIAMAGMTPVPADLDLAHHADNALAQGRRWRTIAEALTAGGTGRDLASALRDYAQDGGIARLRALLERHVMDHGLGQRLGRMRDLLTTTEHVKAGLVLGLQSHTAARGTAADDLTMAASRLLTSLSSYHTRYTEQLLPRLRDPAMIEVSPGWSLRDDVALRAAQLVTEWEQWAEILACVEGDVIVLPVEGEEQPDYGEPFLPFDPVDQEIPLTTEDFVDVFTATCAAMRSYAEERAFEALQWWLRQRHADGLDLRRQVDRTISPQAWQRLAQTRSLQSISNAIDELLEPDRLYKSMANHIIGQRQAADATGQQQDPPAAGDRFPLRREWVLPWSPDAVGGEPAHLVQMLRMRSVFVASVTEIALSDLDDLQYRIYDLLKFRDQRVRLPKSSQHEAFVAAVCGEARTEHRTLAEHAAALDAIRPPVPSWEDWHA